MSEAGFIKIPPEESLLQILRQGLKKAGVSQIRLAQLMGGNRPANNKQEVEGKKTTKT